MDHFDKAYELETELAARNKGDILNIVRNIIPPHVTCIYIRQAEALGLGHAVACAKAVIGNEPFAVLLADDLIDGSNHGGCLSQMVRIFDKWQCSVLGIERIDPSESPSYGIVKTSPIEAGLDKVEAIVEKPRPENAPSNQAVVGRYILTPAIFGKLANVSRGAGGEIQLTDAIAMLLNEQTVLAYEFNGKRYDCGSKLGYLIATVEQGLQHAELRAGFEAYLRSLQI
jgi:UTP--glucose-1-phosphate uridylyltransferase